MNFKLSSPGVRVAGAVGLFALVSVVAPGDSAAAVGGPRSPGAGARWTETKVANYFQVFVPPNNDANNRYSSIVVTALSGTTDDPTVVNLVDDGADGDTDDSINNAKLARGQSLVRYIRDGAVNDDTGGKWDGDYFIVNATKPVSVMFLTDSDWQHDWAPADNGLMRGTRFLLYTNRVSVSNRDVNVFAYEDGTRVELYDITNTAMVGSGITTVRERPASPMIASDLSEGEDLMVRSGVGRDIFVPGRTYELVATRPVTVLFGAAGTTGTSSQARDGGGFVPGRSGTAADTDFYFSVPTDPGQLREQEIRVVAADDRVTATLWGWNTATARYDAVRTWSMMTGDHVDYVGGSYQLYRLTAEGGRVIVYEANWLETGNSGTSDESDFAPGFFSTAGVPTFLTYLGPPGLQNNTPLKDRFSHLYLFSRAGENAVRIQDADTAGTLFDRTVKIAAGGYVDVAVNLATWNAMNKPASGIRPYLRVESAGPIAVNMTNWNDNWMAFATAVVPRNPVVDLYAPDSIQAGGAATFTGSVTNTGGSALTENTLTVTLPSNLNYVEGTLGGQPETTIRPVTGGTAVNFDLNVIQPGDTADLTIVVKASETPKSGLQTVTVEAGGNSQGSSLGGVASSPVTIEVPTLPTLAELAARAEESRVTLTWTTEGPALNLRIERATPAQFQTSDFRLVGTVAHAEGLESLSFADTTVTNGADYYYRVVAQDASGKVIAGPVLAQPRDVTPPPVPTVVATAGDGLVSLFLSGSAVPDLAGYLIERSTNGTSWQRITPSAVPGPGYTDLGRTNGAAYQYRALATDRTGNPSATSAIARATPTAVSLRSANQILAFEDMLGAGENDWDYNDFIVRVQSTERRVSGGLSQVTIDYEPLARGAGYIHAFYQRVPVIGPWVATRTLYDAADPAKIIGSATFTGTGSVDLAIYDDTRTALPPMSGVYANTAPAQARFTAGVTAKLEINLQNPAANTGAANGAAPWDAYLFLPYLPGDKAIHGPAYGGPTETSARLDALAGLPLDFMLIREAAGDLAWSYEGEAIWASFPGFVGYARTPANAPAWDTAAAKPASGPDAVFRRSR
jgi:LruC domain-containing protein/uncharacterized repeat protein (TIGR01451 family)